MWSVPFKQALAKASKGSGPASSCAQLLLCKDEPASGMSAADLESLVSQVLRIRSRDTLLLENALRAAVRGRCLSVVETLVRAQQANSGLSRDLIDVVTRAVKEDLQQKGSRAFLRDLSWLLNSLGERELERRIVCEMIRRGLGPLGGEQRIFRSFVEEASHFHVIGYCAGLIRRWDVRSDWIAEVAKSVESLLTATEGPDSLDIALFVVDCCGTATLGTIIENTVCLRLLHVALLSAADDEAVSDRQRLIWNFSVVSASFGDKENYILRSPHGSGPASMYRDLQTFLREDSEVARLALASEIAVSLEGQCFTAFDTGILLLLTYCAWLPERQLPTAPLDILVARDDVFGTTRLLRRAIDREGETGSLFMRDWVAAVVSRKGTGLEFLGLRVEMGHFETEAEVFEALDLVREAGFPKNLDCLIELLDGLVKNDQAPVAAKVCDREAKNLLAEERGARCVAKVYMAARDRPRAARAWKALETFAGSYHWPRTYAYRAFARAADKDAAAEVSATIDLADALYAPALPMLAREARKLGDYAFSRSIVEAACSHLETYRGDQRDQLARTQAAAFGKLDLFETPDTQLPSDPDPKAPGPKAPGPKAVVIDPGFHYRSGHHFNSGKLSVEFLSEELGCEKDDVWILTGENRDDEADLSLERSVKRVFRFQPYGYAEMAVTEEAVRNLNEAFYQDLCAIFQRIDLSACQVIYHHSMKANMIDGFSRWLARTFKHRAIAVVVGILEIDYLLLPTAEKQVWSQANRRGINRLHSILRQSPLIYCETRRAWAHFRKLMGSETAVHQISYLPAALADRIAFPIQRPFRRKSITFGTLGTSTPDRGSDLFPRLVKIFSGSPEVNWILQLRRRYVQSLGLYEVAILEQAVRKGTCKWYEDRLSVEEYYDAMRHIDVMILPYRDRYTVSGSGVFYEAIQLERFLIVPRATCMGQVVRDMGYPSQLMPEISLEAAVETIGRVIAGVDRLRSRVDRFDRDGRVQMPIEQFRSLFRKLLKETTDGMPNHSDRSRETCVAGF